mgnify:CR=1 FL=1
MRKLFLAALLMLAAPLCVGQEIGGLTSLPVLTEGRYPVKGLAVPAGNLEALATWAAKLVVAANGPEGSTPNIEADIGLVKRQPVLYFSADKPGLYVLCLVDTSSATPSIVTKRVNVGGLPPNPIPTPDPTPTPDPVPPKPEPPAPPVVKAGPRWIFLVREASAIGAKGARVETELRDGPCAVYLNGKNHKLYILSDDKPPPTFLDGAPKAAILAAQKLGAPQILIVDPTAHYTNPAGVLLNSGLTYGTATDIIDLIKKHGG